MTEANVTEATITEANFKLTCLDDVMKGQRVIKHISWDTSEHGTYRYS